MALSTIGTAAIADDAITSAKVDSTTTAFTVADLVVTNGITAGASINAGTELVGNVSGRILLDASASGTDVGDEFLLNATDGSASNDGSKILFEEGTDDPNTLLNTDLTLNSQIKFSQNYELNDSNIYVKLSSVTITSAVAQIAFDSSVVDSAKFNTFYCVFSNLIAETAQDDLGARFSADNGANLIDNSGMMKYELTNGNDNGRGFNRAYHVLTEDAEEDATKENGSHGYFYLYNAGSSTHYKTVIGHGMAENSGSNGNFYGYKGMSRLASAVPINYIKIISVQGNDLNSGTATLYGVRN